MSGSTVLRAAAAAGLVSVSAGALAQPIPDTELARPLPLRPFGRSVAGTDDSTAAVLNPANLAFLPGTELRWSSQYLDDRALLPLQGHAFTFALPVPFLAFSTALRVDWIDPPTELATWSTTFRSNHQFFTWAFGFGISETTSLGFSYRHAYSDNRLVGGTDAWSLGFTTRPANVIGLSAVAHDIGGPKSASGRAQDPSYDLALAIRPFSTRVVELGLEGKYIAEDTGYWVPRATLGVDIPELGRLRGEFSVADPTEERLPRRAWLASAVMSFNFNGAQGAFELSGGSVFGDALGGAAENRAHENLTLEVAAKGYREPAAAASEQSPYALKIRLENTPGPREHVALLRRLWRIAEREPAVAAVVLELRSTPGDSLAHVQELRDAIHHLRTRGKSVLCHLEDADGASLYLCSAAHRILLNPAGGIRFAGLRARYYYYRTLLDKLGIRADFVWIGAHKSAPEAFMQDRGSDVARADKIDLLTQFERHFTLAVAAGRKISPVALRQTVATGPFIAEEAHKAKLVDALTFEDQIEAQVADLVGGNVSVVEDKAATRAKSHFGATPGIALVYVDGDMVDGRSQVIPLLGMRLTGSYTIADSIRQARENPMVGAIVLRIETGGGSALAADIIWREIALTTKIKPVVVSMGSAAASGGYYIAAPATRIFANPLTITGSIGIFYGKADAAELLRRIGVTVEVYKTAPRADAEALYRPFTPEERKELERKVGQFYDHFLSRVAEGRRLTKAQVDAVGQGRVWTGEQAKNHRLVDELGGLRQALDHARALAELPEHAPIVELPPVETTLLGRLIGMEGVHVSAAPAVALPRELLDVARALAPFVVHPADKPLARLELTEISP